MHSARSAWRATPAWLMLLGGCGAGEPERIFAPDMGDPVPREASDTDIAFVGVTVVPMTGNRIIEAQTVVIRGGMIDEIGPAASVVLPAGTTEISGRDRYLMPGLTDMHTHVATSVLESGGSGESAMRQAAHGELLAYLAFGVTTILNNGDFGAPLNEYARQALDEAIPGPTMYTANYARGSVSTPDGGPPNRQVVTAQDGRDFVISSKNDGYEFIKVYNHTPKEAFDAIVEETAAQNMAVVGHFPSTMSQDHALRSGMVMVAHAGSYLWTGLNDPSEIAPAVDLTVETGAFVTGTLAIQEKIARVWGGNDSEIEALLDHPANRFAHPTSLTVWRNGLFGPRWNPSGSKRGALDGQTSFIRAYTERFYNAGVKLLLGSDSPTVLGVAGYSIHEELDAYTRLGLTPFEILEIATVNANEFISQYVPGAPEFGTVEEGKRADLILLNMNPLDDVANVEYRAGVMVRGHWYSTQLLRDKLEALAESYGN